MNILYVTFLIVILDQATKILVKGIQLPTFGIEINGMMLGASIPVLGDFFRITFVENPGMAFGIGVSSKVIFTCLTILVTIGLFYYLFTLRKESLLMRLPLAFILGGAVGNMIDRTFYGVIYNYSSIFQGSVVDFIDIDFIDINLFGLELNRWWIFNIADASVTIGIFVIILSSFISKKSNQMKEVDSFTTPTSS